MIEILLEKGADPNCRTGKKYKKITQGSTPLIIATVYGKTETVRFLLKHKADPNIRNDIGRTPLNYAKQYQYDDLISLLQGDIVYNSEKTLKREAIDTVNPLEQIIRMKDGKIIMGKIVSQTQDSYIVKTEEKTIVIEKDTVDEIRYK